MPNATRAEQVEHLLRLLESCPGPCRVVFQNAALPAGIVINIPEALPPGHPTRDPQPWAGIGTPLTPASGAVDSSPPGSWPGAL
jgi:hypothetical protein